MPSLETVGDWKKFLADFKDEQRVKVGINHMPSVDVEALQSHEVAPEEVKAEEAIEAKVD